jgi:hypothetical protein
MLELVFRRSTCWEITHFHIDYLHFPLSRWQATPFLTRLHGRLDIPDLVPLYEAFSESPVVSISNAQREPIPWLNRLWMVYHSLLEDLYRFRKAPGKYLAFWGASRRRSASTGPSKSPNGSACRSELRPRSMTSIGSTSRMSRPPCSKIPWSSLWGRAATANRTSSGGRRAVLYPGDFLSG